MSTYTPFGLADTATPIIAPFFADIDTRGAGSGQTTFGYGQTTFEGHAAFCVNWLNVGYYSGHTDKTNSVQPLLVSRPESGQGAFDIIFNYDRVEWETGDASGGSNGFGGTPARAGFSSGTTVVGTNTELPGSGVSGAFLDSSPTGLVHGRLGSSVDGRYVFGVRNSGIVADTYVAMGDSFQSGEGAFGYFVGTDSPEYNLCHRAPSAYPQLLVSDGVVRLNLDYRACSGAVISNVLNGQWNEEPQINALSSSTRLVTLGVVGNDLGFGDIVTRCVAENAAGTVAVPFINQFAGACRNIENGRAETAIDSLTSGQLRRDLMSLYRLVRAKAPYARIVVVSYPQFYPGAGRFTTPCAIVGGADQRWLNSLVTRVDREIGEVAAIAGVESVNMAEVLDGHGMCDSDPGMNGILLDGKTPKRESFHPNHVGHRLMADKIEATLQTDIRPTFAILPNQYVTKHFPSRGNRLMSTLRGLEATS
nr:nidogen-like domain-containing protein [Cellulomonas sp. JH27-2]